MPNRLVQVVTVTNLAAGDTTTVAVGLSNNNDALIADVLARDNLAFEVVSCTATLLTVTNNGPTTGSCNFQLMYWNTPQRVFGDNATQQLAPAPFIVGGAASVTSTTTPIPQRLLSPGWSPGTAGDLTLDNDQAFTMFMGFAWRDFAIGEEFVHAWAVNTSGVDVTWAEIALGIAQFIPSAEPSPEPVGFVSVVAEMEGAPGPRATVVTLTQAIPAGSGLWAIMAAASTTTAPVVHGTQNSEDTVGGSTIGFLTTPGWRPSEHIGTPTAFGPDPTIRCPTMAWGSNTGS